jgi:hypothetical protein
MLARLDLELKRAPSLDRETLATLLRARKRALLVQEKRACGPCAEQTENWIISLTSPAAERPPPPSTLHPPPLSKSPPTSQPSDDPADEKDVF